MQLSEFTITALKNFATINKGLVIKPGKRQRTFSSDESILAEVELVESFPEEFGIYDLNQFIGNISTFDNPVLTFGDQCVHIKDDNFSLKYYSCHPKMIKSPQDAEVKISDPDAEFDFTNSTFMKLLKFANMNTFPHISFVGKDGKIVITATEKGNDTSNSVAVDLGDYTGKDFSATFKVENLKFIPGDYHVRIKSVIAEFTNKTNSLKYFVAQEVERKKKGV